MSKLIVKFGVQSELEQFYKTKNKQFICGKDNERNGEEEKLQRCPTTQPASATSREGKEQRKARCWVALAIWGRNLSCQSSPLATAFIMSCIVRYDVCSHTRLVDSGRSMRQGEARARIHNARSCAKCDTVTQVGTKKEWTREEEARGCDAVINHIQQPLEFLERHLFTKQSPFRQVQPWSCI